MHRPCQVAQTRRGLLCTPLLAEPGSDHRPNADSHDPLWYELSVREGTPSAQVCGPPGEAASQNEAESGGGLRQLG